MKSLKVALLQIAPTGTLDGNLEKGIKYCKQAKDSGADIALFPEMWSTGYNILEDMAQLNTSAISANSTFVEAFGSLAHELDMAIGITFLEKQDGLPRNTLRLFDRYGKTALTYAKVHTCDFGDEARISAGDSFYVADLDTAIGNIKIGAMICFDREFPESARILMLQGAEIILVPNACPMEINRLCQLRARAYENMVGIATANYPIGSVGCNGHSTGFDGIAYTPHGESRDMAVLEADHSEGVFIAEFQIDDLRKYRELEVHGNAYRHPKKYQMLVEQGISPPFVRKDYKK